MEDRDKYRVVFYESANGRRLGEEFLIGLPPKVRVKIGRWVKKLQEEGPDLPRPYADIVRGKIRELRIVFASTQYRLLYFFRGKSIIITHGFIKKGDDVPENELRRAQNMMFDIENRIADGDFIL